MTRNQYIFNVDFNISIQFDPGLKISKYEILQNASLAQPFCDWNTGFRTNEFSLNKWLQDSKIPTTDVLTKPMASQLIETLGIGNLIDSSSCERSHSKYSPSVNGWKSECPLSVLQTILEIPATCVILSHCTAIDCCVDVDLLHRSLHVVFDLNVCNNTFTVGIDKLQLEPINLTNIEYGLYDFL
ncbi:unnamed protein product [Mytilus coruscus]|uniref:Uncharacterized protein n=1 Tax=Mytilus coruscus TaxID=42192 RepID=A0A6J8ERJ0_MYTCO|nr:unnamed protein product [Mytilus coruscus]